MPTVLELQKIEADEMVMSFKAQRSYGDGMPAELLEHISDHMNVHVANVQAKLPEMSKEEVGQYLQELVVLGLLFGWRLGIMESAARPEPTD
jgi:hypothetical protein